MARIGAAPPPGSVEAAQDLIQEDRIPEAVAKLEAIVEEYPDFEFALRTLGYLYHEQGRLIDSVRLLERAIEIDPTEDQIKNSLSFRTTVAARLMKGEPPNEPLTKE